MVQGSKKFTGRPGAAAKKSTTNSAKAMKKLHKSQQARKGNPIQLPKGKFRNEALDDRQLSKAIAAASEQKVAAKLIQSGGKAKTNDIMQKGKELSKEQNRQRLTKKVGRVEQKLKVLEEKESIS